MLISSKMLFIKKKLQNIFKLIFYGIFKIIYGKIKGKVNINNEDIKIKSVIFKKDISYKIFIAKKSRLYTDTINDTAIICKNQILEGASFQYRKNVNVECEQNIVFEKGTPRVKKKLNGTVFSLLTGGGGNSNYWHWLFDVLPRLAILKKITDLREIDFFLFPDAKEKFQIETIEILKIPKEKILSSISVRHLYAKKIFCTDHPYNFLNDPDKDSLSIPYWIIQFLRESFLKDKFDTTLNLPKKIYIDRSDAKSGHQHRRKILNEVKVKEFLKKEGFSFVTLGNLDFIDQVKLFNNAECIVGLHGAGFANIVFCKPNTRVIELQSDTTGEIIENVSITNNLKYEKISVKAETILANDQSGDIEIPIKTLESMFK
tara:strand:- start:145 stop:1266 length:1122 start_codon:yes stop_codon:yes gene_type:complete